MVIQWIQRGRIVQWPAFLSLQDKAWIKEWLEGTDQMKFLTSGTTGQPKEIYFSRDQIMASAQRTAHFFDLKDNQNVLHTLPFGFVAGRMNVLRALILKQNLYSIEWKSKEDWQTLSQIPIHWWTSTPMMIHQVAVAGINVGFIDKILLGGGAIPEEVHKILHSSSSIIYEGYGMTETLTHIAVRKAAATSDYFTPMEGVVCESDEHGALIIHDHALKNEVRTSDLVKFNESGGFCVMGRADDVINSGGLKIFPMDVEKWMQPYMTKEFAIVKAPHDSLGEQVVCLHTSISDSQDEVFWKNIFREHPYWRPKRFVLVESLPYNANGKLNRNWRKED